MSRRPSERSQTAAHHVGPTPTPTPTPAPAAGGKDGEFVGTAGRSGELPAEAYATCLATLPGMGPARLAAMVQVEGPEGAWERLCRRRPWTEPEVLTALGSRGARLLERWYRRAQEIDPAVEWQRVVDAGVGVAALGSPAYPPALADDIEPPGVLYWFGSPEVITGPRVAIVGTRRCSQAGLSVALELGRDLTASGVSIVSGLAAGIDGAAHRGALMDGSTPPIGVAGSGLDVVYPPGQTALWGEVAEAGVLLSEAPLGRPPERWRFPARNRIIAALADLVVVVESHARGGSMHTVDEADARGVDVLAVPGSVRNPSAAGTNALLVEGRAPVTSADDVLGALDLQPAGRRPRDDGRTPPDPVDQPVLDALGWQPSTLDQVVLRTRLPVPSVALALGRLEELGWARRSAGWYERIAAGDPQ